ncbi:hypothetical protein EJP67_33430 [Variovorax guangxiensis]|uniref:Uncharacterized protein n=1 Tax=Variovorax guangxiensis TaxID=1775474 RepID=A0A433MVS1_9BURK|nr:hypothetical protein [Variovorax guangxiensis]RUR71955.1 hypothetical protein EJP67_33430 [Variovorax guangxiensis]
MREFTGGFFHEEKHLLSSNKYSSHANNPIRKKSLFLIVGFLLSGCSQPLDRGRDISAEKKVISKIAKRPSNIQKISDIVGNDVVKICLQGRYTPKEEVFEKAVGRPVENYEYFGEKRWIVWWIFDKEDRSYQVIIPEEFATISRSSNGICHPSKEFIYFEDSKESLIYKIGNK